MTRDIRHSIRQVVGNDSARAIVATAAGELIKTLGTRNHHPEERDTRAVASGLGGFAAGAGTATLASVAVRRIGKLIGARRGPRLGGVPRKAAAGTRKAAEVPREAVERFASGLRDQIGGRGEGGTTPKRGAKSSASSARTTAKKTRSGRASSARTTAKKTRTTNGSSGRTTAKKTRIANGNSGRTTAKKTRSTNGNSGRTTAKKTRSANGNSGRTATPARAGAGRSR